MFSDAPFEIFPRDSFSALLDSPVVLRCQAVLRSSLHSLPWSESVQVSSSESYFGWRFNHSLEAKHVPGAKVVTLKTGLLTKQTIRLDRFSSIHAGDWSCEADGHEKTVTLTITPEEQPEEKPVTTGLVSKTVSLSNGTSVNVSSAVTDKTAIYETAVRRTDVAVLVVVSTGSVLSLLILVIVVLRFCRALPGMVLRTREMTHAWINFCVSLSLTSVCLNLTFLLVFYHPTCEVTGLLFHYFSLTTLLWMVVILSLSHRWSVLVYYKANSSTPLPPAPVSLGSIGGASSVRPPSDPGPPPLSNGAPPSVAGGSSLSGIVFGGGPGLRPSPPMASRPPDLGVFPPAVSEETRPLSRIYLAGWGIQVLFVGVSAAIYFPSSYHIPGQLCVPGQRKTLWVLLLPLLLMLVVILVLSCRLILCRHSSPGVSFPPRHKLMVVVALLLISYAFGALLLTSIVTGFSFILNTSPETSSLIHACLYVVPLVLLGLCLMTIGRPLAPSVPVAFPLSSPVPGASHSSVPSHPSVSLHPVGPKSDASSSSSAKPRSSAHARSCSSAHSGGSGGDPDRTSPPHPDGLLPSEEETRDSVYDVIMMPGESQALDEMFYNPRLMSVARRFYAKERRKQRQRQLRVEQERLQEETAETSPYRLSDTESEKRRRRGGRRSRMATLHEEDLVLTAEVPLPVPPSPSCPPPPMVTRTPSSEEEDKPSSPVTPLLSAHQPQWDSEDGLAIHPRAEMSGGGGRFSKATPEPRPVVCLNCKETRETETELSLAPATVGIFLRFVAEKGFEGEKIKDGYNDGKEAVLLCQVQNWNDDFQVAWIRNKDDTVLTYNYNVVIDNDRYAVTFDRASTWELHIRNAREGDRGCYTCQISSRDMIAQVGCLDVFIPPEINTSATPSMVVVDEGDNLTLECSATGYPEPHLEWMREDGIAISLRRETPKIKETVVGYQDGTSKTLTKIKNWKKHKSVAGPVFELWNISRKQAGAYLCVAGNGIPPAKSKRIQVDVRSETGES
ncbi:unnamed protein product [Cyprideis torosa]|uniref:Uncharacterized protein n=1 Tax=Cyprideis torosa TaxID=163714 RepID=A0A7R8WAY2_9CRUS|nr:unnamed protein product [Cyprideis torosa]CAG0888875.1 unnamed protein product [Cyprideis torosa]